MNSSKLPVEEIYNTKRRKVLTTISEDVDISDDDDISMETISICNILEDQECQDNDMGETSTSAIRGLGETIRNTLLEINQIREQNRERRHRELLDVLNKLLNDETQQNPKNMPPCGADSHIEPEENRANHCLLEDDKNESTENNISISSIEKTSSDNVSGNQQYQNTAATESNCPTQNTEMIVPPKKHFKSMEDLKLMRANMLEMQRKKMEDRERKKRDCLENKKLVERYL